MIRALKTILLGGAIAGAASFSGCQKPASENSSARETAQSQKQNDNAQTDDDQQLATRQANAVTIRNMLLGATAPSETVAKKAAPESTYMELPANSDVSIPGILKIQKQEPSTKFCARFLSQGQAYELSTDEMQALLEKKEEFTKKLPATAQQRMHPKDSKQLGITNRNETGVMMTTHYIFGPTYISKKDLCVHSRKGLYAMLAHEIGHIDNTQTLPARYNTPAFHPDPAMRLGLYNELRADSFAASCVGAEAVILMFQEEMAARMAHYATYKKTPREEIDAWLENDASLSFLREDKHPPFGRRIEYMQLFQKNRPGEPLVMPNALGEPRPTNNLLEITSKEYNPRQ